MNNDKILIRSMANATKWSTLSEVVAKLIVPITNMVLARILAPEVFGIIATITMITSFADMLTDAGFQKYLIQHQFKSKEEFYDNANVAFVCNFYLSCFIWIIIALFNNQIANVLGNDGYGIALCVASLQLPLTAFSSIQMAVYKKSLNFKTLFIRRIISIILPFFITIPLALLGFKHWSLIVGTLIGNLANVIILTIYSEWKPKLFFKYSILKEMFSFSSWALIESLTVWLSSNIDTFVIGSLLSSYYLGLYKNSINMINSIMSIITMAFTPVLISGLAKIQNDDMKYKEIFFKAQRLISWIVFPLGVGIFLYRDLAASILFGSKWIEAADVIGIAALIIPFKISISTMVSICYISKGKPKISALSQIIYLIPLIPISVLFIKKGFWTFVIGRNLLIFWLIIINLIFVGIFMNISPLEMCKNIFRPIISVIVMSAVYLMLRNVSGLFIWNIISIFICAISYLSMMFILSKEEFSEIKNLIYNKIQKNKGVMKI